MQFAVVTLLIGVVGTKQVDYCKMDCGPTKHVMCRYQCYVSSDCLKGKIYYLEDKEKIQIVHQHNVLRGNIAWGEHHIQPEASNMQRLFWNKALARIAQRLVIQCLSSIADICIRTKKYDNVVASVGTNRASLPIFKMVDYWFDTVVWFDPSVVDDYVPDKGSSLYTNMMWGNTTDIGCGRLRTGKGGVLYQTLLCLYAPGPEVGQRMYEVGHAGSDCGPDHMTSMTYTALCQRYDRHEEQRLESFQDSHPCGASGLLHSLTAAVSSIIILLY